MTREEKIEILDALTRERNDYARDCERRITAEQGKILGAEYMLRMILEILDRDVDTQESKEK